ncbi:hypothetical protein GCM10011332_17620 [Terasakiella brassicae]|uniref:Response regulatory domain-containing protein n=1 Tax=Terasakiella brassicae TaxID=1634917 RepID=A0A917BYT1_9PROT|nr:hypothetical protein GCM10011332_17620 [Terasakiella brassicae]
MHPFSVMFLKSGAYTNKGSGVKKYDFQDIDILIADQNQLVRSGLKGILNQSGFRKIHNAGDLDQMIEHIVVKCPDLLLCDISLPGGDVCEAVRELRHNQCGNNPFCSIILFIDEPNESIVRAASQAGLDDLQIKPVVAQKVLDRIHYLVGKRKPFVVTTDYIGPDRRSSKRPGTQEIPTMDVPNSIALKAEGKFDPRKFQKDVESSFWNINAQKIERHAFQISYLVNHIVPAYQAGQFNKESLGMAQRLVVVAEDIAKRLEESDFDHLSHLVATLQKVAKSLWESGTLPKRKDLELLPELSAAISATFHATNNSTDFASQIVSSVQKNYK